ncbi:M12 family metallo-peptidase [Microbulbifer sp. 2201CG32-9]|uniref:M12 family metallo-peptidase n=1 Tax=unclassified Microbulbifer TaxID=2619833 RepID=UPI00345C0061
MARYIALVTIGAFSSIAFAQAGLEQSVQAELEAAVSETLKVNLNLDQYSVQRIGTEVSSDARSGAADLRVDLILDGRPVQMLLSPHSVRSPDLEVYTVDGNGVKRQVAAPPIRTYQGSLRGVKDASVAASLSETGQLKAWIQMSGEIWAVQPLSDAAANVGSNLHVVYRSSDILPGDWACGADEEPFTHFLHGGPGSVKQSRLVTRFADVAFDADTEFYNLNGSSVAATVSDIESVMNAVESIYLNETDIGYNIGQIIVRTGADPYSSTSPTGLLSQFRNEWLTTQAGVPRDTAHLMTGKNIDGNVIGIAYLSAVCNFNIGYGLSQSRFTSNFAARVALTAHELGHNWSANHCNGQSDCAIMCSGIGGCTGILNRFGVGSENAIISWANSVSCLNI